MWGQVQGILTGDLLQIGTKELLIKTTLHFYPFHPTLRIKEGVHILFFSNPFRTILSLTITATQTVVTL